MRLLMNAELSTTYADWKKVYDGHKWARDEAIMKAHREARDEKQRQVDKFKRAFDTRRRRRSFHRVNGKRVRSNVGI